MTAPRELAEAVARLDLEQFAGHSPGPWRVLPDSVMTSMNRIWEPGGCDVACCEGDGSIEPDERAANERLIAAAPDLLTEIISLRAALAEAQRDVEFERGRVERDEETIRTLNACWAAAQAEAAKMLRVVEAACEVPRWLKTFGMTMLPPEKPWTDFIDAIANYEEATVSDKSPGYYGPSAIAAPPSTAATPEGK
jgi:hypothetical protein